MVTQLSNKFEGDRTWFEQHPEDRIAFRAVKVVTQLFYRSVPTFRDQGRSIQESAY